MKNIFKITFILLLSKLNMFSQVDEPEHIESNKKTLEILFHKIKINSSGNLCITMKRQGQRFSLFIDDAKEPIISSDNETYCVNDSINIYNRNGMKLTFIKNKINYWYVIKRQRTPFQSEIKIHEGAIKIIKDSIIDIPIEKYKLLKKSK